MHGRVKNRIFIIWMMILASLITEHVYFYFYSFHLHKIKFLEILEIIIFQFPFSNAPLN